MMSLRNSKVMVAALVVMPITFARAAWNETVLHSFDETDGAAPLADVIFDRAGNLYTTTYAGGSGSCTANRQFTGCGAVVQLAPPTRGATTWTESVLYSFQGGVDGAYINLLGVVADRAGNLYGMTQGGGTSDFGTVFQLIPPGAGQTSWTENLLHTFTGGADGASPGENLAIDAAGNLFGTTLIGGSTNQGTVFKLSKPAAGKADWQKTTLYSFRDSGGTSPNMVVLDRSGNLYGTAEYGGNANYGTVFELSPPAAGKGDWSETVLHSFRGSDGANPFAGVTFDKLGNLYGTTSGFETDRNGNVFMLTPPAPGQTSWKELVLYSFAVTDGVATSRLIVDAAGALFGTTEIGGTANDGTVFKLTKPAKGKTNWKATILHSFSGADGANPFGGLAFDAKKNLYGTTRNGGSSNYGTVFEISP